LSLYSAEYNEIFILLTTYRAGEALSLAIISKEEMFVPRPTQEMSFFSPKKGPGNKVEF